MDANAVVFQGKDDRRISSGVFPSTNSCLVLPDLVVDVNIDSHFFTHTFSFIDHVVGICKDARFHVLIDSRFIS